MGDDRVHGFSTSLHLNIGHAYQELGEPDKAYGQFARAAEHVHETPEGQYGDWNRFAIAEGLRATGTAVTRPTDALLTGLLTRLCARADLKALGLLLPTYLGDLGTDEDRLRLRTAMHMLHAARWLPEEEQKTLSQAIDLLTT